MLTPIRASGPTIRRAAATGISSCPRWTPSASASRATSGRSLTMNSAPAFRVQRRTFRARSRSSRSESDFSRSWKTWPRRPPPRRSSSPGTRHTATREQDVQPGVRQPVPRRRSRGRRPVRACRPGSGPPRPADRTPRRRPCRTPRRSAAIPAVASGSPPRPGPGTSRSYSPAVVTAVPTSPGVSRAARSTPAGSGGGGRGQVVAHLLDLLGQEPVVEDEPAVVLQHPQGLAGAVQVGVHHPGGVGLLGRLGDGERRPRVGVHRDGMVSRWIAAIPGPRRELRGRRVAPGTTGRLPAPQAARTRSSASGRPAVRSPSRGRRRRAPGGRGGG